MWNPFKKVKLEPVIVSSDIQVDANIDKVIQPEVERALLESLNARNRVASVYEGLASRALHQYKGGVPCLE